jgi:hypothetical protein
MHIRFPGFKNNVQKNMPRFSKKDNKKTKQVLVYICNSILKIIFKAWNSDCFRGEELILFSVLFVAGNLHPTERFPHNAKLSKTLMHSPFMGGTVDDKEEKFRTYL